MDPGMDSVFDTSSINNGQPLFNYNLTNEPGFPHRHCLFRSYQRTSELSTARQKTGLRTHIRRKLNTELGFDQPVIDEEKLEELWQQYKDDWELSANGPALSAIRKGLQQITQTARQFPPSIYILGLPSLRCEHPNAGADVTAVKQFIFAFNLVRVYFQAYYGKWNGGKKEFCAVYVDSTHLRDADWDFVKTKFVPFEKELFELHHFALTLLIREIPRFSNRFVLSVNPRTSNPLRQMLADVFDPGNPMDTSPALMLCAPWWVDHKPVHEETDRISGDRSSDKVKDMQAAYKVVCTIEPAKANLGDGFGHFNLFWNQKDMDLGDNQVISAEAPASNDPAAHSASGMLPLASMGRPAETTESSEPSSEYVMKDYFDPDDFWKEEYQYE